MSSANDPTTAMPAKTTKRTETAAETAGTPTAPGTLLVGLDLGTNKSCIKASADGVAEEVRSAIVPSVVGYAEREVLPGILPDDATILFGEEALRYRLHLRLAYPLQDGNVGDVTVARDFISHLRRQIDPTGEATIKAVIGMPANANSGAREALRESVKGIFERVLFIPEPFLAALGCREEAKLGQATYSDPVTHSLFVDIGAGTTDLCMIQGYFPTAEDQISFPFAGNAVDGVLAESIRRTFPDTNLSEIKVQEIKEQHSYVGPLQSGLKSKVYVGGKPRTLDVGELVGQACNQLLMRIFENVKQLIHRAPSDAVENLLRNIILTGGGSRIRNLAPELERMLAEEGYEGPRVSVAGKNFKEYVSLGALKAARSARPNQWQHLL